MLRRNKNFIDIKNAYPVILTSAKHTVNKYSHSTHIHVFIWRLIKLYSYTVSKSQVVLLFKYVNMKTCVGQKIHFHALQTVVNIWGVEVCLKLRPFYLPERSPIESYAG